MKSCFLALLSCLSLSSLALAKESVKFPDHLTCQSIGDCVAGLPDFCKSADYFPQVIDELPSSADKTYDPSGILTEDELSTKVMIDFTDGDQYSFYFFDANDMTALAEGRVSQIQGTYEDGFDWVNGYNTRAKFKISCEAIR